MALVWDAPGDRVYESGIDRGVLYLPSGDAVPWNGLTSVVEHSNNSTSQVYFDGMKIQDLAALGDFSANMKAVTYPEEFNDLEGIASYKKGMFFGNQIPKMFGLSYRVKVGNDLDGDAGYKIHVLYNTTAIAVDKSYSSNTDTTVLSEFEWVITAVAEEIAGFRPTAHFIFDTREFDPNILKDLEAILYGDEATHAYLPPMSVLFDFIDRGYLIKIVDNGDGTWTMIVSNDSYLTFDSTGTQFTLVNANVVYSDAQTFTINDTVTLAEST